MFRYILFSALLVKVLAMKRYDNYKVFEVSGQMDDDIHQINRLEELVPVELDFWRTAGRDIPAHISVAPEHQNTFVLKLQQLGLRYKVVVENVQSQIDVVDMQMAQRNVKNIKDSYMTFEENQQYLANLETIADGYMSIVKFGTSPGGRDLFYVKVSTDRFSDSYPEDSNKPVIWVESTTHAREWITNACALNLITWLVENYGKNSNATEMLDTFDWFIVPVHNPDGYSVTFTHDRLWRKTYRPEGGCSSGNGRGDGVDPNRNWDFQWGSGNNDSCAADYQGPRPFSEKCTKGLADQIARTKKEFRAAFISLHSYSQLILLPYGYNRYASVPRYEDQVSNLNKLQPDTKSECNFLMADQNVGSTEKRVADAAAKAILDRSGTTFRVGNPGDLLFYNAPGGAYDYALGALNYTVSLTYELHPAGWNPGFQLPQDKIWSSFVDFLDSIHVISEEVKKLTRK